MRGGITIAVAAAGLAVAGCAAKNGQLQVRALADPASKLGVGSERLAEARGQLALGNVGLAIEAFQAALREQPDNVDAMNGLAGCYDAMGRTDLSRHYYEAALAVAPRSPAVLTAFAASLDAGGDRTLASQVRTEAAQASGTPPPVTIAIKGPIAVPPPTLALASSVPSAAAALPAPATSVTIALPPPKPVVTQRLVEATSPPAGPRLQRLSPGEVALLTAGEPAWQARVVARTAQSTTLHWVALADGDGLPKIRLLNAARVQGLAARTRDYLVQRGWRRIEIGDAGRTRQSSLIMYPGSGRAMGRSLAAQLDFRPGVIRQGQVIVVLLGRDAAMARAAQARG